MQWYTFTGLKPIYVAALVGLIICPLQSQAQAESKTALQRKESNPVTQNGTTRFLKYAARHNEMEIALTEVGARKAQNPDLKQYCQTVQQEQIRINHDLQPIARQYGVAIDRPLTRQDQSELTKLEAISGNQFDRRLTTLLLREEQRMTANLQQASSEQQPSDVQQYAQQTLPKERQELQTAQTTAKELGVSTPVPGKRRVPKAVGGSGELE